MSRLRFVNQPNKIRIVTYNLLSPALGSPAQHIRCDEDDLSAPERLRKIKNRIEFEVIQKNAICCLQEVGLSWRSDLFQLFDDSDYTYIDTHYGNAHNDHMGLVIAFPHYLYKCHSMLTERLSESYIDYSLSSSDEEPDEKNSFKDSSPQKRVLKKKSSSPALSTTPASPALNKFTPKGSAKGSPTSTKDSTKDSLTEGKGSEQSGGSSGSNNTMESPFANLGDWELREGSGHISDLRASLGDWDAQPNNWETQPESELRHRGSGEGPLSGAASLGAAPGDGLPVSGAPRGSRDPLGTPPGAAPGTGAPGTTCVTGPLGTQGIRGLSSGPAALSNAEVQGPNSEGDSTPAQRNEVHSNSNSTTTGWHVSKEGGAIMRSPNNSNTSRKSPKKAPENLGHTPWSAAKVIDPWVEIKDNLNKLWSNLVLWVKKRFLGIGIVPTPEFAWDIAEKRQNRFLMCRFHHHNNPRDTFALCTYHNPCLFGAPERVRALQIHTIMLMQKFQEFAGTQTPRIVCGDFNLQPMHIIYDYLSTASDELLSDMKVLNDRPTHYKMWYPDIDPLDSAYVLATGKEPAFTNYASRRTEEEDDFMACLDYIWLSKSHWEVPEVIPLPTPETAKRDGVMPNFREPSDHLMLGAELVCRKFDGYQRQW